MYDLSIWIRHVFNGFCYTFMTRAAIRFLSQFMGTRCLQGLYCCNRNWPLWHCPDVCMSAWPLISSVEQFVNTIGFVCRAFIFGSLTACLKELQVISDHYRFAFVKAIPYIKKPNGLNFKFKCQIHYITSRWHAFLYSIICMIIIYWYYIF